MLLKGLRLLTNIQFQILYRQIMYFFNYTYESEMQGYFHIILFCILV